ncbi:unnamed protein product [Phytophthora fragariaefolia]|uniref:Unnamed protein product n=1 Tax=Phytophthora fragariaefolia TaxID=1490495 RepID=A0A9W6Y8E7_9STRA|nr:unnamed protein product [Phytophthora fragariaefolia]
MLRKTQAERRWKAFEALWATPIVVLEARGEHREGLGRLLHTWLDAYHALWCVFLPDVLESGWKSSVKYRIGSKAEGRRTVDRALCVCRGFGAVTILLVYAIFYTVVYFYDVFEAVCQGVLGVGVVISATNYWWFAGFADNGDLLLDESVLLFTCAVVGISLASHLLRWYESCVGELSPAKMASNHYAEWQCDLEELDKPNV